MPFGEELSAGVGIRSAALGYGADGVRQKFTSKERDAETGLDYFLARYYSSTQGRFISPDEFTGGPDALFIFADAASANPTFYADLTNPQSLNKYQYTYNNPLSYTDSDGHCPECPAYWLNSKIQQVDAKITQIKNDLVDYGKGLGKSAANTVIDMANAGGMVTGAEPIARYEPSNEVQAMAMGSGDKLILLSGGLGTGAPVNVATAEGKGAAVVASEVGMSSNAARRAAMRESGIPTSQQPLPASQQIGPRTTVQGKNYEYDVPGKGRMAVQQTARPGPNEPHGPHWEAGRVKPKAETRKDPLGRPRLQNDKSRVEYQ